MPTIINTGFRNLGTGFASAQAMSSLPYVNRSKAVGRARGQVSKAEGQINDAIGKIQQVKAGVNQVADTVGDVLGLFGKRPGGELSNEFDNYKVKIYSTKSKQIDPIVGYLQGDSLDMSIKANWDNMFPPLSGILSIGNIASQAITGQAVLPMFSTRRVWAGASPLRLSLPLKFQTTKDSKRNVLDLCQALQHLISPEITSMFTVRPPGPNPYRLAPETAEWLKKKLGVTDKQVKEKKGTAKYLSTTAKMLNVAANADPGELITINIGRFLTFTRVIVTDVDIKYATKFDKDGIPISADASITFETFEILTKSGITKMYKYTEIPEKK